MKMWKEMKTDQNKKPLTHNLDEELSLVLAWRVGHADGVDPLVVSHRPLDHEAAQGLILLHADPSLSLRNHLPQGQTDGYVSCCSNRWVSPPTRQRFSGSSDWRTDLGSGAEVGLLLTWSPFIQHTSGAGSPVISTSKRSLFPATTVMVFLSPLPVSMWILGGSFFLCEKLRKEVKVRTEIIFIVSLCRRTKDGNQREVEVEGKLSTNLGPEKTSLESGWEQLLLNFILQTLMYSRV